MKLFRAAVAMTAVLALSAGGLKAAGYFPGFPIVGAPAYCSSVSGIGNTAGTGAPSITGTPGQFGQGNPNGGIGTGANINGNFASVCNVFVPAGPTSLTGNELVTVDTQLPSGQSPQTVSISTVLMGAGATNYQAPLTGATVSANYNESSMLIDPAGTIAALTVNMPGPVASLRDGQTWRLASSQTITALTLTPASGTTIAAQTPTALTVSTTGSYNYEFQYKASNAKWYRIQ
jgi:hypothetical protein